MEKEPKLSHPPFPLREPQEMHVTALIHDISRITHERVKHDCPEMQRSCRLIMMELAHRDNVTQLELVRATHLKAPTVSVSLQKMEHSGIVMRKRDVEDLRATRVFLTDKGRDMHNHIISKIKEQENEAESALTEEEKETLKLLLCKIHSKLIGGTEDLEESR